MKGIDEEFALLQMVRAYRYVTWKNIFAKNELAEAYEAMVNGAYAQKANYAYALAA